MAPAVDRWVPRVLNALQLAARSTGIRLATYSVLALVASWTALSRADHANDFRDAHMLQSYERVGAATIADHAQLPMWDPYACGGLYSLGGPQTRVASPTVLLSAAMGTTRAEALLVFVFLILGMEGFFRYGRMRVGSALGPFLAAPIFGLNGYFAISWSLAWINFLGFELIPWLLLGTAMIVRGRAWGIALVVLGFAFLIGFGGTYPVPLGAIFVALEAVRGLLEKDIRTDRRKLATASVLLVCAAALTAAACAYRLWPVMDVLQSAPRIMAGRPSHSWAEVSSIWFWLAPRPGEGGAWPGVTYVGPAALLLAGGAVLTRRAIAPLLLVGLCAWLATGYAYPVSAFRALKELPIFETFRYPERFLVPGSIFLAELAALGIAAVVAKGRQLKDARYVAVVMCAVAVVGWGLQVWNFGIISLRGEFVPEPERVEQPFAQARGNRWVQSHFVALNRGSINCGEAFPVPMSDRLRGDLTQEEYLADPTAGTVQRVDWSPNKIELVATLERPSRLVVNQNFHPGWSSSAGEVVSHDRLIGVELPKGRHELVLRFLPRSAIGGGLTTLAALVALGFLIWHARRRGGRASPGVAVIAAIVPLVTWGALATSLKEPKLEPVLRNANGTPLLVDVLPEDAVPVGAKWDVPVELVAVRIDDEPDADGLVHMEFYWRVTGEVPRSVGIFVHLAGPENGFKNADHEVVGGTWFFERAPRGVLLRDAFGTNASENTPGTWKVLVGLWHASGDGTRVPMRDRSGQPAKDNRLEVGSFTVPPR